MKKIQTKETAILDQVKKLSEKKRSVQVCATALICQDSESGDDALKSIRAS